MRPFSRAFTLLTAALLVGLTACGDDGSPGGVDVSGSWSGVSSFASGFSTSMTLTQTGTTVTGQMRVSGSVPSGTPVNGTVDALARSFAWAAFVDCVAWGGVLSISADGQTLTGPVLVDNSGCQPAQSNSTGTMNLSR